MLMVVMAGVVVACFLGPSVLMLLAMSSAAGGSIDKNAAPSANALADIPPELLPVYQQAAKDTCGMPWGVLAAIGKVETDHGRSDLPGVHSGANFAGAEGPMQFEPGTWAAYGVDGNHDGATDVYNPVDAIWGAANYLCANGAGDPARLRDAIWNYNRDWGYVDDVLRRADDYATAPAAGNVPAGDAAAVLNNPNISLCPACRQDLIDGVIDQRVIDFLAWAAQRHSIAVSVLKTGHNQFVAGTNRVSNHWEGRAADIATVDGQDVSPSCTVCRSFAEEVVPLGAGRPDEMGVPWADMVGAGGWNVFSDGDHQFHVHVGFNPNPPGSR
ncbi:MAG: lytic transglycosylase domain-containing protein [Actinomycetota bacterium]|nr:lytic transglycosylase domain-containing protein [Actinomycetota bacterium]